MGSSSAAAANHTNSPSFVQPLLQHYLNSFSIPKSFEKHLEVDLKGHSIQTVILMSDYHPHRHWLVTVQDSLRFSSGWQDFCLHHHLRVGDFLVFSYQSNLMFHVTVFDPISACQRVSPSLEDHVEDTGSKRMRAACKIEPEESEYEDKDEVEVEVEVEDEDEVEVKDEDEVEVEVEDEDEDEDEGTSAFSSKQDYPSCLVRLTSYNLNKAIIYLPAGFVREHGLQFRRCQLMIVDAKRKVWPVIMNYKKGDGQVYIKKGWKPFLAANRFKPGNFLCFQLLNGGTSPTLKCHRASALEIELNSARKKKPKEAQVEDATASSSEEDQDQYWYRSLE